MLKKQFSIFNSDDKKLAYFLSRKFVKVPHKSNIAICGLIFNEKHEIFARKFERFQRSIVIMHDYNDD